MNLVIFVTSVVKSKKFTGFLGRTPKPKVAWQKKVPAIELVCVHAFFVIGGRLGASAPMSLDARLECHDRAVVTAQTSHSFRKHRRDNATATLSWPRCVVSNVFLSNWYVDTLSHADT